MSNLIDIKVPDIGDFKDVPVIEVFVKVGDTVKAEDPLVSLESDKATMDVPAPHGGVVKAIPIKVGDKVSEGSVIMQFDGGGAAAPPRAGRAGQAERQRAAFAGERAGRRWPRCASPTSATSRTCR